MFLFSYIGHRCYFSVAVGLREIDSAHRSLLVIFLFVSIRRHTVSGPSFLGSLAFLDNVNLPSWEELGQLGGVFFTVAFMSFMEDHFVQILFPLAYQCCWVWIQYANLNSQEEDSHHLRARYEAGYYLAQTTYGLFTCTTITTGSHEWMHLLTGLSDTQ